MREKSKMRSLREEYISFIERSGKKKATATTYAREVFALWNKCGEEYFWSAIHAEDNSLREMIADFLESYCPGEVRYISNYLSSIRCFRDFLASKENEEPIPVKRVKAEQRRTPAYKNAHTVLTLTDEMLEREHQKVLADPVYGSDYALVDSVFNRFPDNTDPEVVALKICLIDTTMSTMLSMQKQKITVKELASIIVGIKDFDERLRQGDPALVTRIAKNNGNINLFSFASKYCTFHAVDVYGIDDYVIFDDVVQRVLPLYVSGLAKTTPDKWRQSYDYIAYKKCIDELLDANGIDIPFRHRKLDHFLWNTYRTKK